MSLKPSRTLCEATWIISKMVGFWCVVVYAGWLLAGLVWHHHKSWWGGAFWTLGAWAGLSVSTFLIWYCEEQWMRVRPPSSHTCHTCHGTGVEP